MHLPLVMRTLSQLKDGLLNTSMILICNSVLMICTLLWTTDYFAHSWLTHKNLTIILFDSGILQEQMMFTLILQVDDIVIYSLLSANFVFSFIRNSFLCASNLIRNIFFLLQSLVTSHHHKNKIWFRSVSLSLELLKILFSKVWLYSYIVSLSLLYAIGIHSQDVRSKLEFTKVGMSFFDMKTNSELFFLFRSEILYPDTDKVGFYCGLSICLH